MTKPESFDVTYEVDDGYVGGSRPQGLTISAAEFDADDTEATLRQLFREIVEEDFRQNISWYSSDEDRFIEWALSLRSQDDDS